MGGGGGGGGWRSLACPRAQARSSGKRSVNGQEEVKTSGGGDGTGRRRGQRGLEGGVADELSRGKSVCALLV